MFVREISCTLDESILDCSAQHELSRFLIPFDSKLSLRLDDSKLLGVDVAIRSPPLSLDLLCVYQFRARQFHSIIKGFGTPGASLFVDRKRVAR
jgi:hypothetical protein